MKSGEGAATLSLRLSCPGCGHKGTANVTIHIGWDPDNQMRGGKEEGASLPSYRTSVDAMKWIRKYWKRLGGTFEETAQHGYPLKNDKRINAIFVELVGKDKSRQCFDKFFILRHRNPHVFKKAVNGAVTQISKVHHGGFHCKIDWSDWKKSIKVILDWAGKREHSRF